VTPIAVPVAASGPTPGALLDQRPYLSIPELGVYSPIIEVFLDGVSWDVTRLGIDVGHLQGTAWLDEPGNIVLSGHVELSDGRKGAFRDLEQISIGRRVSVVYAGQTRHYEVVEQYEVDPTDLTPLYPSDGDRLTLITCGEYDFFSNTYLKRIVVVADRVG
jgi:LPXTG-site transpeptidase (sortase) family protein